MCGPCNCRGFYRRLLVLCANAINPPTLRHLTAFSHVFTPAKRRKKREGRHQRRGRPVAECCKRPTAFGGLVQTYLTLRGHKSGCLGRNGGCSVEHRSILLAWSRRPQRWGVGSSPRLVHRLIQPRSLEWRHEEYGMGGFSNMSKRGDLHWSVPTT